MAATKYEDSTELKDMLHQTLAVGDICVLHYRGDISVVRLDRLRTVVGSNGYRGLINFTFTTPSQLDIYREDEPTPGPYLRLSSYSSRVEYLSYRILKLTGVDSVIHPILPARTDELDSWSW